MQKVYLNMVPGSVPPIINAAQFDSDRPFQLEIMDGSAAADLTGLSVKIDGLKPDNYGFQYDETSMVGAHYVVSVTGNVVTIRTPVQMTAVDGRTVCTLEITDGDDVTVSSLMFYLQVQKSPLVGVVISETELPAIIALAQQQEEDAEAWANGTRGGVPVSSDDPAYHNNSKYYMEQAEEAGSAVLEKYPKIVNNYWYIWDVDEDDYVNTGVRAEGTPGEGVPAGGTTGQVLAKASGTDYDTEWVDGGDYYMEVDGSNSADLVTLKNRLVVSTYPSGFYILGSASKAQGVGELITFTFDSALSVENFRRFEALIDAAGVTGYRHNNFYKGITIKSVATSVVTAVFEDDIEDAISVPAGTQLLFRYAAYAGNRALVSGSGSVSYGADASAVGYLTVASGTPSHAEGNRTLAAGGASHAEGHQTQAIGSCAHAEGHSAIADGLNSHAEGNATTASGSASHAEGTGTRALADYSHVEGGGSSMAYAAATYAHVEGYGNFASAAYTHVEGRNNNAAHENQHVSGKYNNNKSDTLLEVGNGTSGAQSNAFEVTVDGYIRTKGRADKIAFGVDGDGNYGYIPAGADTVIPFSSGGTALTIQITTSSAALYGQTVTITKNGTTVGTTTFDNQGEAEYTVDESGTYTVSVTLSGTTFTDTVEVIDTFDAQIEATPDGSTVTPVNDIQTWLHCANVWDKNYTTISQVLTDTTTLLALINSNNAVDYMVRSHDWCDDVCADATAMTYIGANDYAAETLLADDNPGLVPQMTSATTPSGNATASTVLSSDYDAWRAFNDSEAKGWVPNHSGTYTVGDWLKYDFGQSVVVSMASASYLNSTANNIYFKIQGSNDDFASDVHDLCTEQSIIGVNSTKVTKSAVLSNIGGYRYYRLYITTASLNSAGNGLKLQFYAKDGSWLESICNSTYFESVLNVKVPTMTSNTTPSGVAFAQTERSTYPAWWAFDGVTNQPSVAQGSTEAGIILGYRFSNAVKVHKIVMTNSGVHNRCVKSFKMRGSNDGSTYTDASGTLTNTDLSNPGTNTHIIGGNTAYNYWCVSSITLNNGYVSAGVYYMIIDNLQLYGRADV